MSCHASETDPAWLCQNVWPEQSPKQQCHQAGWHRKDPEGELDCSSRRRQPVAWLCSSGSKVFVSGKNQMNK